MNMTEVKKSLERQFDRELTQGSKRNTVFWYDEEGVFATPLIILFGGAVFGATLACLPHVPYLVRIFAFCVCFTQFSAFFRDS